MRLNLYLKSVFAFALTGMISGNVVAQKNYFSPADSPATKNASLVSDSPAAVRSYQLKTTALRTYLLKAPLESVFRSVPLQLEIPLPDGRLEMFALRESPVLAPALASKYPSIKTYAGKGVTHPDYQIRLSMTGSGFDAIILGVSGDAVYISKKTATVADQEYLSYFAKQARKEDVVQAFGRIGKCEATTPVVDLKSITVNGAAREAATANNTGSTLRTFRLAMAATGEFTQRKGGGNVTNAYNALVAYVNRMNAVYRAELSVAFTLVSGENIVYPNPNTDPYNNADQSAMLAENQQNLDKVIGNDKYDVGHVLGVAGGSGGGIASFQAVCKSDVKGQGVSGVGDGSFAAVFDDQLISHEVGHQFGMSHTFNSSIPVCTTREAKTSVETGSGTTIMSYGYTCSDKTGNDDYESTYQPFLNFHTVSYEQAVNYINTQSCYSSSALANAVPVINKFPSNTTIPKSTPFALTGSATDANAGDNLTYSWEGTNIGLIVPDPSVFLNTAQPPFFRSYAPVSTGTRTYPRLEAILNGSNTARGDKLPSVGIETTHRMTVRDNAGGLTYQTVTVTIDGNSGPFLETTNLAGRYTGSTQQTITWNVANTNNAPVNCTNVDILLSTDGGQTFPTTLVANTPNDGSEPVTFPNVTTGQARIKIQASNNVFFDISNSNFTIVDPNNQPPVAAAIANQTVTLDAPFSFVVPAFTDPENQPLTYTATGLPSTLTFNPTTRTISGTPNALGTANVTIIAADPASATAAATFTITINAGPVVPLVVNLVVSPTSIPANGSTSGTATVSGGRAPYTYDFGTDAGAGISTTGNRVTYTEMSAGDHNLTVKVIDSTLPTAQTVTASFKVTVGAQGATPVVKVNSPDPIAGESKAGSAKNPAMAKNSTDVRATANEDIDPGIISFTRSTTVGTLVVYYSLGGTATPGVDFLNLPGSVTFAEGESEILIEVDPIADDSEDEGDETVIINLIDKDDYDPDPTQTNTTVTIKDKTTATPSSLTITSFTCNVTNSVLSSVNFVVGNANGTFSPQPAPIFINGVTGNGQLGVNYFLPFDNNQSTLTVQDQATRSTYFVWNFRQACATTSTPPNPPTPTPSSLTITSFTCNVTNSVLSSVNFVVGNANGTFSPQPAPIFINGVTGNGQLGVNYFLPFDNNQSMLTVQDQATRSTYFMWNFRQACAARGGARESVNGEAPWVVSVLGNPTSQNIDVVITGAKGETLMMSVTDAAGRPITSRRVEPQTQSHKEVFDVSAQSTGLLLLKTSSDTHAQTIKVIKN